MVSINYKEKAVTLPDDGGVDREVDARGLKCPMPLLLTRSVLANMEKGQLLCLKATDLGLGRDVPLFVRQCGHRLEGSWSDDMGELTFLLRKGT